MERADLLSEGHVGPLLAAYSLGILDDEEVDAVERHLDACPACRAEAAALRDVTASLALAAPPLLPPPGVMQRLSARIAAEGARAAAPARPPAQPGQAPLPLPAVVPMPAAAPGLRGAAIPFRARTGLAALVAAAAVLALAVLGTRSLSLQHQLDQQQRLVAAVQHTLQHQMADQGQVLASLQRTVAQQASSVSIHMLHGTASAADAIGTLVMSPHTPMAVLVVHNLPAARTGVAYDCWLYTRTGQHIFVGTIVVDRHGDGYMPVHAPQALGTYHGFGVTAHAPSKMSVLQGLMDANITE